MKKLLAPLVLCSMLSAQAEAITPDGSKMISQENPQMAVINTAFGIEVPVLKLKQPPIVCASNALSLDETRMVVETLLFGLNKEERKLYDENHDGQISQQEFQDFLDEFSRRHRIPVEMLIENIVYNYIEQVRNTTASLCDALEENSLK